MSLATQVDAVIEALRATAETSGTTTVLYARTLAGQPVASLELPTVEWTDPEDSVAPIGFVRMTVTVPLVVYVWLTKTADSCVLALNSTLAIVDALNANPSLGATVEDTWVQKIESFANDDKPNVRTTAGYVVTVQVTALVAA